MILVTDVEIEDFRSIQRGSLEVTSGYVPIVGPNNSGKSNILRALNLFFNDEVEPGRSLNLNLDFHNPSRNRKKQISVSVTFDLPSYFKYRKNIRLGLDETLGRHFAIRKSWSYPHEQSPQGYATSVQVQRRGESGFSGIDPDEVSRVHQFLNLIRFRYQPNHIHPSDVLRQEEAELQSALLFRLNRAHDIKAEDVERVFAKMKDVASDLVSPISDHLKQAARQVEELELSTPTEFGDLLFSFVPKLKVAGGEKFDALQHGSGIQSFLTYLMLAFLDTRFDSKFGWQQATIWAIEEPESFLHQALQHQLAEFLASTGESDRFQIFCTTHSEVFTRYADHGVLCRSDEGRTEWNRYPVRVLTGEAARRGVTPYVHPLLFSSPKPLLLVEGSTDRIYMESAFRLLGLLNPWVVRDLSDLDAATDLKGVDGLRTYLNANRGALKTRPLDAPCFVLIDWNESSKKVEQLRKELGNHTTSKVIQWFETECNPDLDQTFAGIERALSTSAIRAGERAGLLKTLRPSDADVPLVLDRASLKKTELAELVRSRGQKGDFTHFWALIERLQNDLRDSIEEGVRLSSGELFR